MTWLRRTSRLQVCRQHIPPIMAPQVVFGGIASLHVMPCWRLLVRTEAICFATEICCGRMRIVRRSRRPTIRRNSTAKPSADIMKKALATLVVIVMAWYAILFACTRVKIMCRGVPAMVDILNAGLPLHYKRAQSGEVVFGDASAPALGWSGGVYERFCIKRDDGTVAAVSAVPRRAKVYRHNLLVRVVFLNFDAMEYPTHVIAYDGNYCLADGSLFSSSNPPGYEDVVDLSRSSVWRCRQVRGTGERGSP